MKKILALFLSAVLLLCLVGCYKHDAVLDEAWIYEAKAEVHSLDIRVNAADFKIEQGDKFSVESNLKYLSVREESGVLILDDETKRGSDYEDAMLKLTVPRGAVFDTVDIRTGAAEMTVDTLPAKMLNMKLGAGDVLFEHLYISSEIDIEGGAGEITVLSGTLSNLDLEMGMGELELTAALLGDCDLEFGVGESDITLIGTKDDYTVDIDKGLGSITVDGTKVNDFGSSGSGKNRIDIQGGVGEIHLNFREE